MAHAKTSGIATRPGSRTAHAQYAVPMSLRVLSPWVALFDVVWIVLLSIAAGHLYDAVAHGRIIIDTGSSLGAGIAVAALFSGFAHSVQLYLPANMLRLRWQVGRSVFIWLIVFLILATLVFLLKIGELFSRGEMILFFSFGIFVTIAVRFAVARTCAYIISSQVLAPNQVVVVGLSDELSGNETLTGLQAYGYVVIRAFPIHQPDLKEQMREVVSFVRLRSVDEVILAIPWDRPALIRETENELRALPVSVKLLPDTMVDRVLGLPLVDFGPTKAVELQRAPLSATQRYLKGIMDQVLAAIGLLALLPLFAVIALAICIETPGPALFMQLRVGFNGRPFRIFKFRTMSTLDDGPTIVQATRNDKRLTRLGGLLRKLSIDEIPQLLNVLRGEMSLVGPRPHAVAHDNQYEQLIATYAIRHKMKPGITGWAQVNGFRGETAEIQMMERRIEHDLWYAEYWSLWLDIRILLMTVVRVMKTDKAY